MSLLLWHFSVHINEDVLVLAMEAQLQGTAVTNGEQTSIQPQALGSKATRLGPEHLHSDCEL